LLVPSDYDQIAERSKYCINPCAATENSCFPRNDFGTHVCVSWNELSAEVIAGIQLACRREIFL
jgi:hypothetical protein